jgi:hypothetical protein
MTSNNYPEEGISLIGLTLTHFWARPKPGPGFPASTMVFFTFNVHERGMKIIILVDHT